MNRIKKLTAGKKVAAVFGLIIGATVALLLSIILILHVVTPIVASDFFANSNNEYVTPGIYDGLVPQGYAYVGENDIILQCGYMADGVSASRIYVTNASDPSDTFYVELYTEDGQPYTGHTGGITSAFNYVWLCNDEEGDDNCVWVLSLHDLNSKDGRVILKKRFQTESRAACCFVDGVYLWVGEFYDGVDYKTKDTHSFVVDGEENNALVFAYSLNIGNTDYGIDYGEIDGVKYFTPALALSVPDLLQGFCKTNDGRFVLSASYGVKASYLYFYSDVTSGEADSSIKVNDKDVPVYFLDDEALTKSVLMPPMSEEIFLKDGKIYVLFESASQKYVYGNFTHGIYTFSYNFKE